LQAYIKNYYEMIMIAKKFKTYVFSRNNHVLKEKELFIPQKHYWSSGQFKLAPLGTWLFPGEQLKPFFSFGNLFSSILFLDEKDDSRKCLNP
jgi:hypothetical protein